ncbi:MAG: OsmC family protein [Alteraurantiacibacter sp.]
MSMKNSGSAVYDGLGKDGKGHVSTGSGALSAQPYGFNTRFEDAPGTNPEELIGAAHASCFTMALAFKLGDAGHSDGTVTTSAEVTLEKVDDGFCVSKSALSTKAKVPGMDQATFEKLANEAKEGCPISKLLDTEITLETEFEG